MSFSNWGRSNTLPPPLNWFVRICFSSNSCVVSTFSSPVSGFISTWLVAFKGKVIATTGLPNLSKATAIMSSSASFSTVHLYALSKALIP